jgi:hypothetical protein
VAVRDKLKWELDEEEFEALPAFPKVRKCHHRKLVYNAKREHNWQVHI